MKTISLVLTIYNQSLSEIERWLKYFSFDELKKQKHIKVVILNDNPNLNHSYFVLAESYGFDIPKVTKNFKKAGLIRNAILTNVIKTDYIKICDPDDYINIENFIKFSKKICKLEEFFIHVYKVCEYEKFLQTSNIDLKDEKFNMFLFKHPVNYNTIYITQDLAIKEIEPKFTIMDDVYASVASMVKGRKIKYWNNDSFYIWSKENGVSHLMFNKNAFFYKVYDDFSVFEEQMDFYRNFMILNENNKSYFHFGKWFVKSAQNSIISSRKINKYFSIKAILKMASFFKLYNKIYNEERQIPYSYKFIVYTKTLFGRKI